MVGKDLMWLVKTVAYLCVAAIFLIVGFIAFVLGLAFTDSPLFAVLFAVLIGGGAAAIPFVLSSAANDVIDRLSGRK